MNGVGNPSFPNRMKTGSTILTGVEGSSSDGLADEREDGMAICLKEGCQTERVHCVGNLNLPHGIGEPNILTGVEGSVDGWFVTEREGLLDGFGDLLYPLEGTVTGNNDGSEVGNSDGTIVGIYEGIDELTSVGEEGYLDRSVLGSCQG